MTRTVTTTLLSATGVASERTNTAPFQQCSAKTDPTARGGYIRKYTAFYDRLPDVTSRLRLHCFRRPADAVAPYMWELESTFLTGLGLNATNASGDGHNSISLGVDENGILHAAWQAHHNEYIWCYWEGEAPGDIEIDSNTIPPGMPALCSYPKFTNNADGTLNFWARQGVAGNGEQRLHEKIDGVWTEISAAVIAWTGAGDRSPYMHHIATNASGEHLVCWVWADNNYTAAYLGLKGFKCRRVSPGVWSFYDWEGETFSLPADDDVRFTIWDVPINRGTPVHHGAALKDDGSPIVSLMNAGDAPNTSTNRYRFTRYRGAWVRQLVQEVSPTWNLIDANGSHNNPAGANSEYQQASQADVRWRDGVEHWIYRTNYAGLDGNGIPQIQSITTLDNGLIWSEPKTLVELPAGDMQPTLIDVAGQYTGGANSNVHLVNVDFGNLSMGTLSTYTKDVANNHLRNKAAAHSPAATHYLHLYSGVGATTPLAGTGNGYAAVSKTNNTTSWPNAASRIKASGVAWTFPTPTGTWPNVTGWKLTDNPTEGAGNVLASDTHDPIPVSVALGPLSYGIGLITITAASAVVVGGWSDAVVHGLLNLIFGGTAYAQLTTTHGSYWAGDPRAGGTIAGGSVSLTQASVWGTSSGGMAVTATDIALAQQVTGTYWAEHDAAAGGGNLLYTAPRPATVGASGTIQAGQLQSIIQ